MDPSIRDQMEPEWGLNGTRRVDPTNRDQSKADRGLNGARRMDPTNRDQSRPPSNHLELIEAKRAVVKEIGEAGT